MATLELADSYPAKALWRPGETAEVVVELSSRDEVRVELLLELRDRLELVAESRVTVDVAAGSTAVRVPVETPTDDARGYAVSVTARWPGGAATASTALLVASHWRLVPRYGFLSDFADTAAADPADPVAGLARFHITAVQFYDWMYRHYRFLPPPEAVRGEDETFTDAMGRDVSLAAVRRRVAGCREHGMAAIAYGAVYGPEPEFALDHPEMLLYDSSGSPLSLIELFYITDLRPGAWRERIVGEFEAAVGEVGFDGIHMDQYGFPKLAYDASGELVDLAATFPGLIDEAARRVAELRDGAAVIFNAVNDWPIHTVAGSDQAAMYIEVWSPNDAYRDLVGLIRRARELSGKQAILAAYLKPFHTPGEGAEWALRYATAVINAAGGHHLVLGEGDAVLREPYYPDHGRLSEEGSAATRRLYDHTAAHTHYLHALDLQPVERYLATGINGELNLAGAAAATVPEAGKVWIAIQQRPGQLVVNLVNLTGLGDDLWDAPREAPPLLEGLRLLGAPFLRVRAATWASPDEPGGTDTVPLAVDLGEGGDVAVAVPPLRLWGTIVIDHD